MPNITYISDLHLEFDYQPLPGGDLLILAGDICELRSFKREFHSTRSLTANPGTYKYCDFFYNECTKYNRVLYVLGNHEHYHGRLDQTKEELENILPDNIRVLENDYEEYDGVLFLGATFWTDCNRADPVTCWTLKSSMNDFRVIKNHYKEKELYHKLIPEYTVTLHRQSLEYFKGILENNSNKPVVVITHHAPSNLSIHEQYKHDYHMNGGYASRLENFILDHPNIKYWIHGHMHDPVDYELGTTRVVSNPRGYVGHEDTTGFNPTKTLNL